MSRSWRGALGEVALIFVGISLALFVENWNEERRARGQEHELLTQVLEDLRATSFDLTANQGGDLPNAESAQEAQRRIMDALYDRGITSPAAIADDLEEVLETGSRLYPQTAGYQSLKTIGVDLITDDSLRIAVIQFFEGGLSRVATAETTLWESQDRFLEPYMFEHFQRESGPTAPGSFFLGMKRGRVSPRGPEVLGSNSPFPLILDRIAHDRARLISQYKAAESAMNALIERLEVLLAR